MTYWPPFQAGDVIHLRKDFNRNLRRGRACKVLKIGWDGLQWQCITDLTKDRSPWACSWFIKRRVKP